MQLINHVFIVAEHTFNENKIECFNFNEFNLASKFCRTFQKNGGVAIFTEKNFSSLIISIVPSLEKHFEITSIKVDCKGNQIIIIGLY